MITKHPSPLRYPGGKASLTPFLTEVIQINGLDGGIYVEPFAGGAGAALKLLFAERVSKIFINDLDKRMYAFWKSVLTQTDDFVALLKKTPVNIKHWNHQKKIFRDFEQYSQLEVGFATFYLNRCNRSGVLNGGPIGGTDQTGNYKIDARFNKSELQKRVEQIGLFRDRITVKNLDGIVFLNWLSQKKNINMADCLVYMDPPYFEKAPGLYYVYFQETDHQKLAAYLGQNHPFRWVISYDDAVLIRTLYKDRLNFFPMQYSMHTVRIGDELIISSTNCKLPQGYFKNGHVKIKTKTADVTVPV